MLASTSAIPHMPMPPMPTKWILVSCLRNIVYPINAWPADIMPQPAPDGSFHVHRVDQLAGDVGVEASRHVHVAAMHPEPQPGEQRRRAGRAAHRRDQRA